MGLIAGAVASAIAAAAPGLIKSVVGEVGSLADKYLNKEISRDELEAKTALAMTNAFAKVETEWARAAPEVYKTFMQSAERNPWVLAVWVATALSQLLVILWHQVGIPFYTHMTGIKYPSSGETFVYAYMLLAACVGVAPFVKGMVGGSSGVLKNLIGR